MSRSVTTPTTPRGSAGSSTTGKQPQPCRSISSAACWIVSSGEQHAGSPTTSEKQLTARLARIEGQVRGLQRMIGRIDRACVDVLTQIAAAQAALDKVSLALLDDHVQRALRGGEHEQAADDVLAAVARLLRAG